MAKSKLYLNGINIESVKLGTSDVKLYLGETLVYPLGPSVNVTYDVATYDRTLQTAQNIVVTDNSGNTLVENVDYVVSENNGGTNAGNYPLILTFIGQYEGTFTTSFIINKVTPTVIAPTAITGLVYNASEQTLVNGGSTDYGTLKYSLDNVTYDTTIPSGTNASSYTVYYKVEGDSNVNDVSEQNFVVNIAKVTPTVVAPTAKVLTYNGSAQELVNAGSTDYGTLKYSLDNTTWSTSIPTATNYGSYTVYYKVEGDSNVNDVAAQSVACSINEKQVTATVELSQNTYTYNGSACEPTVTVKDGSTVIDPSEYTVTYSNNVNAGTATVTISDNVGGNYEVIGSATFTINKADVTYTAPTTVSLLVYNGNAQELLNAGTVTGGTMKYSTDNVNWSTDIPSGTNASSYTSYWKIDGDVNHNDVASSSIITTIAKADSSLSFAVTNLSVGVGETKTNAVTVNAGDGTLTYSSNNTSAITVDNNGIITGVGIGNATITANISQTQNYNAASASYSANCRTLVTVKYNVTDTSKATIILYSKVGIGSIEVDGIAQSSVVYNYTFDTVGEHTVKYYLNNTNISNEAFAYCKNATSCIVGDGVTSINDSAFYSATSLTSIVIPDSVTNIGHNTFRECTGLTSVTIPDSVTTIGNSAFTNCISLTSCTIGDSVTSIGRGAFINCSGLTSIDIPDSVTSISDSTFTSCISLSNATIGSGVTSIGGHAFQNCSGLTNMNIPNGVTSIGEYAFYECYGLTSIVIPDSVTSIGGWAFTRCSGLTSCTIGDSVTSIGSQAFNYCSAATSITVNAITPPTLAYYAFERTNDCPIYVPCDSVDAYKAASYWSNYASRIQAIQGTCWDVINKVNVTSTRSATQIASATTGFSKIEIDGVEMSPRTGYTFSSTGEHTVKYLLTDPTTIGASSFERCTKITNVVILGNVETIDTKAFAECSTLTSVTIGDGVTTIGDRAFQYCHILTSIDVPSGVTSIGDYAFQYCSGMTNVTIGDNVTSIGNNAFYSCWSLTNIDIPDSVTTIGESAFTYCSGITTVTIGSGVTSIGSTAFYRCIGLTSFTFAEESQLISIGSYTFTACSGLTNVNIPDGVTYIGSNAFQNCYGLTSCTIGNSVTSISDITFSGCTSLKRLNSDIDGTFNIPSGVTSIGESAFVGCSGMTSVNIPSGVTSLGNGAFAGCNFTSIVIPSGVTSTIYAVFSECHSLTSITSNAMTAPTANADTFRRVGSNGILTVPIGSTGYDVWMGTSDYYLGLYNWTKVELPSGYKICEYIGNQGAAYIDTNITLDFTEDIEIKYSVLSYSNAYGSILGYYSGETMNTTRIIQNNGNSNSVLIYYNSKANGGSVAANVNPLGEINVIKLTPTEYVVNGTTVTKNATQGTAYNAPLKIFTSSRVYSDCRIYSFSISGKCNMIPCISPNSVVGMYDTVRNQFFSSANSTDLVAGPIIGEV